MALSKCWLWAHTTGAQAPRCRVKVSLPFLLADGPFEGAGRVSLLRGCWIQANREGFSSSRPRSSPESLLIFAFTVESDNSYSPELLGAQTPIRANGE